MIEAVYRRHGGLLAVPFLLGLSCDKPAVAPNVLIVSIDTLRRDHVSAYGYARSTTPHIDRLAEEGALFEDAISTSNWTLPAHMSLLTGLRPSAHQVEDDQDRLPHAIGTLAESLTRRGYLSAGYASHVYLDETYGFDRGFATYEVDPRARASAITDSALAWLGNDRGRQPFFLFLHYFDPHWDFAPPAPYDRRFAQQPIDPAVGTLLELHRYLIPGTTMPDDVKEQVVALYDGEIAYTDAEIGRLIDALAASRELDDTIVVVVSDHGEEFGEHDSFGHATHLHGEVLRVPFIVRYPPAIAAATRVMTPVALSDVPATVTHLIDGQPDRQFLGHGRPLLDPAAAPAERTLVAESTRWGPKRFAVRRGPWKLLTPGAYRPVFRKKTAGDQVRLGDVPIHGGLFRLDSDRAERTNVAGIGTGAVAAEGLLADLEEYVRAHASGVLLRCSGRGAIAAEIATDTAIADEPFVLQLAGWVTTVVSAPDRVGLRLHLDGGAVTVGIALPVEAAALTVSLASGDEQLFHGRLPLPAPGATRELGRTLGGSICELIRGGGSGGAKGEVALDAEQLEQLRSLGYIP